MAKAATGGGPPAGLTDDFNRANGGLGANWANGGGANFSISSNQVVGTGVNEHAFYQTNLGTTNHYIEIDWDSNTSSEARFYVASSGTNGNGYWLQLYGWANAYCEVYRNGSNVGNSSTSIPGHGTVLRVSVTKVGSLIRGYVGATLLISYTDPGTALTGLKVGFGDNSFAGGSGLRFDNFEAGDI